MNQNDDDRVRVALDEDNRRWLGNILGPYDLDREAAVNQLVRYGLVHYEDALDDTEEDSR